MNGLLPYNNAGLVDPYANSMAGGLGMMYGIQEEQAKARDLDQKFYSDLNKYDEDLRDKPLNQAKRANALSEQGILADQYGTGAKKGAADAKLESETEIAKGQTAASKAGPQLEYAAQQTAQFVNDMESIKATGGPMAQQEYWNKNVAPMFKQMGGPTEFNPERLDRINQHLQTQTAQAKSMQVHKLAADAQIKGHELQLEGVKYSADHRADKSSTDALFAKAIATLPVEEQIKLWAEKATQGNVKTATLDKANLMAAAAVKEAQDELDDAEDDEDKDGIRKATKKLARAKARQKEILRDTMNLRDDVVAPPGGKPPTPPGKTDSVGDWVKKNGIPKTTQELGSIPVTKTDAGKTMNIGGVLYKLIEQDGKLGWKKQ